MYPVATARALLCSYCLHCASVCAFFFSPLLCSACVCVCACFQSLLPFSSVAVRHTEAQLLCGKPCSLTAHSSSFPSPVSQNCMHVGVRASAPLMRRVLMRRFCREVRFEAVCFALNGLCCDSWKCTPRRQICRRTRPDAARILPARNPM